MCWEHKSSLEHHFDFFPLVKSVRTMWL